MGRQTVKPRPLNLEELFSVLMNEDEQQRSRMTQLTNALAREDYMRASELLESFSGSLSQHIADEETRVLKECLELYGKDHTSEGIKVFQHYRSSNKREFASQKLSPRSREGLSSQEVVVQALQKSIQDRDQVKEESVSSIALKSRRQSSER